MCLEDALMNWLCQLPVHVNFSDGRTPAGVAKHVHFRTSQVVRICSTCKKEIDDLLNLRSSVPLQCTIYNKCTGGTDIGINANLHEVREDSGRNCRSMVSLM